MPATEGSGFRLSPERRFCGRDDGFMLRLSGKGLCHSDRREESKIRHRRVSTGTGSWQGPDQDNHTLTTQATVVPAKAGIQEILREKNVPAIEGSGFRLSPERRFCGRNDGFMPRLSVKVLCHSDRREESKLRHRGIFAGTGSWQGPAQGNHTLTTQATVVPAKAGIQEILRGKDVAGY